MSLVGPSISVVFAAVTIILCITSTASDYWVVESSQFGGKSYYGLWRACASVSGINFCATLPEANLKDYMKAARGLMITAIVVAGISWIFAVLALIEKRTGVHHLAFFRDIKRLFWIINGVIFSATGLLVMAATTWYGVGTGNLYKDDPDSNFSFGYSIILGWICCPLMIIAGVVLAFGFRQIPEDLYSRT